MNEKVKTWTLLEILNWTADYLKGKNFENPRLNAERLLCHTLRMKRVDLYLNFQRPLSQDELENFKAFLKRKLKHEPLQYIIGETEFMSLKFKVNRKVLIPRSETEVLVERTIERCQERYPKTYEISILDIGTGSGNIAVSLARYLENAKLVAVDQSSEILEVARENARSNGVIERIDFIQGDIFDANFPGKIKRKLDGIVSNPPYISDEEFKSLPLEIKNYEPVVALHGGTDGYAFFKRIAQISRESLNERGFIALEISLGQKEQVTQILRGNNFPEIESFRDLNGIERVIWGRKLKEIKNEYNES